MCKFREGEIIMEQGPQFKPLQGGGGGGDPRLFQLATAEERLADLLAHHGNRAAAEVDTRSVVTESLHRKARSDSTVSRKARADYLDSPLHAGASFASPDGAPVNTLVSPRYSPAAGASPRQDSPATGRQLMFHGEMAAAGAEVPSGLTKMQEMAWRKENGR